MLPSHSFSYCKFFQLHTSELNDGYDWNKLNLQSVTEQDSLNEFLSTAELAGTEFAVSISPILLFISVMREIEVGRMIVFVTMISRFQKTPKLHIHHPYICT